MVLKQPNGVESLKNNVNKFGLTGFLNQNSLKVHLLELDCYGNILCNCEIIEQEDCVKYIQVVIDEKLRQKAHLSTLYLKK